MLWLSTAKAKEEEMGEKKTQLSVPTYFEAIDWMNYLHRYIN